MKYLSYILIGILFAGIWSASNVKAEGRIIVNTYDEISGNALTANITLSNSSYSTTYSNIPPTSNLNKSYLWADDFSGNDINILIWQNTSYISPNISVTISNNRLRLSAAGQSVGGNSFVSSTQKIYNNATFSIIYSRLNTTDTGTIRVELSAGLGDSILLDESRMDIPVAIESENALVGNYSFIRNGTTWNTFKNNVIINTTNYNGVGNLFFRANFSTSSIGLGNATMIIDDVFMDSQPPANTITVASTADSYRQRQYINVFSYNGSSDKSLNAYLCPIAACQNVVFTVVDLATSIIPGVQIIAYRLVNNALVPVIITSTDDAGSARLDLDPAYTYTISFSKADYKSKNMSISPTFSTQTVVLGSPSALSTYWRLSGNIQASCGKSSSLLICNFSEPTGYMNSVNLQVYQVRTLGTLNTCSNSSTLPNSSLSCPLGTTANKTFTYTLTGGFPDGSSIPILSGLLDFTAKAYIYGSSGLWMSMILVLALGLLGIYNPVISMMLSAAGIGLSWGFGILNIGEASVIGMILTTAIMIYRMRS